MAQTLRAALLSLIFGCALLPAAAHAHVAVQFSFDNPPEDEAEIFLDLIGASPLKDDLGGFEPTSGAFTDGGALLESVDTNEAGARYYEYTVTPEPNVRVLLEFVGFQFRSEGASGPTDYKATVNGTEVGSGTLTTSWNSTFLFLSDPEFAKLDDPIVFRIYLWGASSASVGGALDGVLVSLVAVQKVPALAPAALIALAAVLASTGVVGLRSSAARH